MSLKEQFNADLKEAMKSGDATRRTVIRGVLTSIKESEQRKREDLVKQAVKKHNISRPVKASDDTDESFAEKVTAYDQALEAALSAEGVEEAALLSDAEQLAIVQKLVKQRQDSIEEARKAGRDDIASGEEAELTILVTYLPEQLSREDIEKAAKALIEQTGAADIKDMGKVMGPLMKDLQGKADGKLISEVVRSLLAG